MARAVRQALLRHFPDDIRGLVTEYRTGIADVGCAVVDFRVLREWISLGCDPEVVEQLKLRQLLEAQKKPDNAHGSYWTEMQRRDEYRALAHTVLQTNNVPALDLALEYLNSAEDPADAKDNGKKHPLVVALEAHGNGKMVRALLGKIPMDARRWEEALRAAMDYGRYKWAAEFHVKLGRPNLPVAWPRHAATNRQIMGTVLLLLRHSKPSPEQFNTLADAAVSADCAEVLRAVRPKQDPEARRSLLLEACWNRKERCVRELVRWKMNRDGRIAALCRGARLDVALALGATVADLTRVEAMLEAAWVGNLETIRELHQMGVSGHNAGLSCAAENGQVEAVRLLLELGADNWSRAVVHVIGELGKGYPQREQLRGVLQVIAGKYPEMSNRTLIYGARKKNADVMRLAFECGAVVINVDECIAEATEDARIAYIRARIPPPIAEGMTPARTDE